MTTFKILVIIITITSALSACENFQSPKDEDPAPAEIFPPFIGDTKADLKNQYTVTDYGNGVYYFDYVGAQFGSALATFLLENPDLTVTAVTQDLLDNGKVNHEVGYWVICTKAYTIDYPDSTWIESFPSDSCDCESEEYNAKTPGAPGSGWSGAIGAS